MNQALITALGVLADEAPHNTGPDFGKASPFGLLVIVLLLLGTFLLVWSMNRQLKKVPKSFDRESPEADQATDTGTAGGVGQPDDSEGSSSEPAG